MSFFAPFFRLALKARMRCVVGYRAGVHTDRVLYIQAAPGGENGVCALQIQLLSASVQDSLKALVPELHCGQRRISLRTPEQKRCLFDVLIDTTKLTAPIQAVGDATQICLAIGIAEDLRNPGHRRDEEQTTKHICTMVRPMVCCLLLVVKVLILLSDGTTHGDFGGRARVLRLHRLHLVLMDVLIAPIAMVPHGS